MSAGKRVLYTLKLAFVSTWRPIQEWGAAVDSAVENGIHYTVLAVSDATCFQMSWNALRWKYHWVENKNEVQQSTLLPKMAFTILSWRYQKQRASRWAQMLSGGNTTTCIYYQQAGLRVRMSSTVITRILIVHAGYQNLKTTNVSGCSKSFRLFMCPRATVSSLSLVRINVIIHIYFTCHYTSTKILVRFYWCIWETYQKHLAICQ